MRTSGSARSDIPTRYPWVNILQYIVVLVYEEHQFFNETLMEKSEHKSVFISAFS